MKQTLLRILLVGIAVPVLLLGACASMEGRVPTATAADLAEAKATLWQRFVDGFAHKDLDMVMSCFWKSPDLILVLYGNTVRGWDGARAGIEKMFADNETIKLEVNEVNTVLIGDMIMAVGTATFNLQPKTGPAVKFSERWTDLERKIDGKWVYVLDHATMLPP